MIWSDHIAARARALGFDLFGIAPAREGRHADAYRRWLDAGYAGAMTWMAKDVERRTHPAAKTVVACGLSYFVREPPPELWNDPSRGRIARYAWGRDYHEVMLPMLKELAEFISAEMARPVTFRTYVDTGPVLERDLAAQAGLGFVGKNTCVINPEWGSYFFVGEILLDAKLGPEVRDQRSEVSCGQCHRCLDVCPTGALVEPYVLDARRCISYLSVENKGPIPEDLRPLMGRWIFGCDECQQVCPWNDCSRGPAARVQAAHRAAATTRFLRFDPDTCTPRLADLLSFDEAAFRERFEGTPVARAKREGLLRNAAVAAGNSGDTELVPWLEKLAGDPHPLVREHAKWAIARLRGY